MKTQQECWEALEAGHVLVDSRDGQEVHLVDGNVIDICRGCYTTSPFIGTENWHIKPKKLPFVEALLALASGECKEIRDQTQQTVIVDDDGLLVNKRECTEFIVSVSDFDAEWELLK